ncbi:hypothetical protein [Bradyrhizobium sp.]|jgi:hypothetical protein|uniref:hypothetical protein n=1 Tax=Bradyrhizobium sp. TaxID=376 RepID=UPI003C161BCD
MAAGADVEWTNEGDDKMEAAAIALAILGVAVGAMFRLKVLLAIVALLLVASLVFSLSRGFTFQGTALTILAAQCILQGSYFLGLVIRAVVSAAYRMRLTL